MVLGIAHQVVQTAGAVRYGDLLVIHTPFKK
jgi:hypothetical protein